MKLKTLILSSVAALLGRGPALVRSVRTRDSATAFLYRMPAGIPGCLNRVGSGVVVEPNVVDDALPPLAYGVPVVLGVDGIRPVGAGDTPDLLYGVLVRPFPTNEQTTTGFFGSTPLGSGGTPPASGVCDVMKKGYMTVKLYGATAAIAGGAVFVRIANAGAGEVVGGFEAADDGADNIQAGVANTTYFRGPADADGNVEIAWNV